MIDYKELRIENWIRQSKRSGGVDSNEFDCQVHEVNAKGLNVGYGGVYLEWQFCEGIPLSEEILGKCGFVLDKGVGVWFETKQYNKDKTSVAIWDSHAMNYKWSMADNKHISITYLHQLQNLYYSLTNY